MSEPDDFGEITEDKPQMNEVNPPPDQPYVPPPDPDEDTQQEGTP